jgi:aspartate aminotransferase-like enzyme
MAGNTWRIGVMGAGATRRSVSLCLAALRAALIDQGQDPGVDPLLAAGEVYAS